MDGSYIWNYTNRDWTVLYTMKKYKQPLKEGDRYEDCSYDICTAVEVTPLVRGNIYWWHWLVWWVTNRAHDWDIVGYNEKGLRRSCSFVHCAPVVGIDGIHKDL